MRCRRTARTAASSADCRSRSGSRRVLALAPHAQREPARRQHVQHRARPPRDRRPGARSRARAPRLSTTSSSRRAAPRSREQRPPRRARPPAPERQARPRAPPPPASASSRLASAAKAGTVARARRPEPAPGLEREARLADAAEAGHGHDAAHRRAGRRARGSSSAFAADQRALAGAGSGARSPPAARRDRRQARASRVVRRGSAAC